jgi:Asp-tRNA(Asn)/Glu-tRNA(Gln) amidotransferase A subunit family amidase
VVELVSLSASEAAQRIGRGALTSESLVRAHLERVWQRDDGIRAWAYLALETALAQARARDRGPHLGPLQVGIQLIGRRGGEEYRLDVAAWVRQRLG